MSSKKKNKELIEELMEKEEELTCENEIIEELETEIQVMYATKNKSYNFKKIVGYLILAIQIITSIEILVSTGNIINSLINFSLIIPLHIITIITIGIEKINNPTLYHLKEELEVAKIEKENLEQEVKKLNKKLTPQKNNNEQEITPINNNNLTNSIKKRVLRKTN